MADSESRELEERGIELAKQGQYAEARSIFQKVLLTKTEPLSRADVVQNIMRTHEREGNKEAAIETAEEILKILGAHNLLQTIEGTAFHGEITGDIRRLQGHSALTSPS